MEQSSAAFSFLSLEAPAAILKRPFGDTRRRRLSAVVFFVFSQVASTRVSVLRLKKCWDGFGRGKERKQKRKQMWWKEKVEVDADPSRREVAAAAFP